MKALNLICLPNIVLVFVVASDNYDINSNELNRRANPQCVQPCPNVQQRMVCGYDAANKKYKMFKSRCHMEQHCACQKIKFVEAPLLFCIRNEELRRSSDDSCPVFCPDHYRPVCGASKLRDYKYRSFKNGCYLDMINCRSEDEYSGYIEVPLSYCQRHGMRNIWKEQVVVYNSPILS